VIPTEEDEWMMDHSLRLRIEHEIESPISLLWSLGIHYTETVHHTMDVCIDTDIRHIIEYREDNLRRLDPDTWEGLDEL
jgi:hypothetical protein